MELDEVGKLIKEVLVEEELPVAAEDGKFYDRLVLQQDMDLSDALILVKSPPTVHDVLELNLGKEAVSQLVLPHFAALFDKENSNWDVGTDYFDPGSHRIIDLEGVANAYVWIEETELSDSSETTITLQGRKFKHPSDEDVREALDEILVKKNLPAAAEAGKKYARLVLKEAISLDEALRLVKNPPTVHELLEFNLGKEVLSKLVRFGNLRGLFMDITEWYADVNAVGGNPSQFIDLEGDPDAYIWIEATELLDPDETKIALEEHRETDKSDDAPTTFPEIKSSAVRYAARYQPIRGDKVQWGAVQTLDEGIKPGDILLTHHPIDDDIAKETLSWATHAGIAASEHWAVDANKQDDVELDDDGDMLVRSRGEHAVRAIPMTGARIGDLPPGFFWYQEKNKLRKEGGVIYRYIGDGKSSEADLDKTRQAAAKWAFEQIEKKYKFILRSSKLVTKDGKKVSVVEKEFDDDGKALGPDGKPLKVKGDTKETHAIYCAELVWRAYRDAGVNIVDPKQLDLLADKSQGVPSSMIQNIDELQPPADPDTEKEEDKKERLKLVKLLKGVALLPRKIAMPILVSQLRSQTPNKLYFCAPGQLASTPMVRRLAQFEASSPDYETITFHDFRKSKTNPAKLVLKKLDIDDGNLKLSKKEKKKVERQIRHQEMQRIMTQGRAGEGPFVEKQISAYRNDPQFATDWQQLMADNGSLTQQKAQQEADKTKRSALRKEFQKRVEDQYKAAQMRPLSEEELQEQTWENYLKKNKVRELKLSVFRVWEKESEKMGPDLRLGYEAGFNTPPAEAIGVETFKDKGDF